MNQTVLHSLHLRLNAKMTEFQGWQVPLQYAGVSEEHHAVRSFAGLFDVGHLGRIEVSGPGAQALLQKTFTRDIMKLHEGAAQYGLFCNEGGFILDDAVILSPQKGKQAPRYLVCTNALNTEKMLAWLRKHAGADAEVRNVTAETAQLALQGPLSDAVLEKLAGATYKKLKPKSTREKTLAGLPVLVSHTGYTGEHGYELFLPSQNAETLWTAITEAGAGQVAPCGIAVRDALRLEMGYVMYGYEIGETRRPFEAGLGGLVDLTKDFIGKEALAQARASGSPQRLAGFVFTDRTTLKPGSVIYSENREIGAVTSSAHSPSLRQGIGFGYVTTRYAQPGQEIEIEMKDREIAAKIVELPFYRKK